MTYLILSTLKIVMLGVLKTGCTVASYTSMSYLVNDSYIILLPFHAIMYAFIFPFSNKGVLYNLLVIIIVFIEI
jgi:hypothetical protein